MNITQTGRQIIRQRGTDTAEQCMNVFLANKNTALVKFTAGAISGLLHQFEESIPGKWSRLGPGSISDDTIISYFLTPSQGSTPHEGRTSLWAVKWKPAGK